MIRVAALALAGGVLGCLLSFTMNGYQAATARSHLQRDRLRLQGDRLEHRRQIVFALAMGFLGGWCRRSAPRGYTDRINALREGADAYGLRVAEPGFQLAGQSSPVWNLQDAQGLVDAPADAEVWTTAYCIIPFRDRR